MEVSASRLAQLGYVTKFSCGVKFSLQTGGRCPFEKKMNKNNQQNLIEIDPLWKEHWKEMPEFVMNDESPQRTLRVHFRNQDDVDEFAKLIGQKISPKTKSIWHPQAKNRIVSDKHYVDES